jgi:hypothetical protein
MSKQKFSPTKYIKEKGRINPIDRCFISDGYEDKGLTICLIIRKQPGGKFMFANFVVDRYCFGVKDAFTNCNFEEFQIDELIDKLSANGRVEEVSPAYFHNLIYAAIDFAEDNGFKPHKDFTLAEYVLDPALVDDGIDEIELGDEEGKPLFISGPFDNVNKIIATLDRNVGKGNYSTILLNGS